MDKYRKVIKPKETVVKDETEIRLTAAGSITAYVARAAKVYNEMEKPQVVVKATGNALTKAVTLAEVIKRRFKGIHQITSVGNTEIVDEYEPLEEGLDKVTDTRTMPFIEITLSKEPLDTADKGYQAPIDESLVSEFDPEKLGKSKGKGRGKGRGKGKGKGKGKEKKGKGKGKGKGKAKAEEPEPAKGKGKKGKGKGKGKAVEEPEPKGKGKGKSKGKGKGKEEPEKGKGKGKGKGKWEEDAPKGKGKGKDKGKDKGKSAAKSKGKGYDTYEPPAKSKGKGKKGSKGSKGYDWYGDDYSYGKSSKGGKAKGKGKGKKGW